jgi:TrmH family RNA methyltransferase
MTALRSRDNPKVKRWSRLVRDGRYRRKEKRALIEGPHLVAAALQQKIEIFALLVVEDELSSPEIRTLTGKAPTLLSKSLFRSIVDAENLPGIAAEIEIPAGTPDEMADSVFLEGVQDAGNVGAIMRSAAAFGIRNFYVDKGCADPWSPKVLRAAMGGHFQLAIVEGKPTEGTRLICTVVKGGSPLKQADLSGSLCWVFGSEGKGVSPEVQRKAAVRVTIPIEPGTESLNVAAAAAICLYEAYRRRET